MRELQADRETANAAGGAGTVKTCRDCGAEVSGSARSCPTCGAYKPAMRWFEYHFDRVSFGVELLVALAFLLFLM